MIIFMENQKKPLVKAPQELIHIKHTISIRQYKYWFLLLKAYKDFLDSGENLTETDMFYLSMATLTKLIGYEPQKRELKADLEALRIEPITLNYFEKDGTKSTHGMGFISEWKVNNNRIGFRLPTFLIKVLKGNIEAKQLFLLLNWEIFNSFGGKYEAIIYKLCRDYIGVGRTPYFSVEEYREYMGLKSDEYNQFFRLKEWTISKPIKNINKNEMSDILVEVVLKKQGRNVIGLHFEMKYKPNSQILKIESNEPNPAFEKSLITFAPQKQREYLEKYSLEQIKAIINYVNTQNELKEIKNLGGYYAKAFENGWGLENFEAEQKKKAEEEERKRQAKAERKTTSWLVRCRYIWHRNTPRCQQAE